MQLLLAWQPGIDPDNPSQVRERRGFRHPPPRSARTNMRPRARMTRIKSWACHLYF